MSCTCCTCGRLAQNEHANKNRKCLSKLRKMLLEATFNLVGCGKMAPLKRHEHAFDPLVWSPGGRRERRGRLLDYVTQAPEPVGAHDAGGARGGLHAGGSLHRGPPREPRDVGSGGET